jgi:signal transduction histidine kinase
MNIHIQGDLLTAILTFALALSVILRGRPYRQQFLYALFAFNLFGLHLCGFLFQVGETHIWQRVQYSLAALVPITGTMLLATFLPEGQTLGKELYSLQYVLSPMFIIGTMSPLYRHRGFPLVLGAYVYAILALMFVGLLQGMFRAEAEAEKRRLKYLLVGGVVTLVFVMLTNMDLTRPYFPAVGNTMLVIFLYFMSQMVTTYRIMDLQELLGKVMVVSVLAIVLSAIFGILVAWVGKEQYLFFFNTVIASFVILILFDPIRAAVEAAASRIFLARRFEFARQLQSLRRKMASVIDAHEMVETVLDALWATRRVTHASVYLIADDFIGWRCTSFRGPEPPERVDIVSHRGLITHIQENKTPLLLEIVERKLQEAAAEDGEKSEGAQSWQEIRAGLRAMNANILLPLLVSGEVAGVLALNDVRAAETFSADELAILMGIAEQAGVTLENYRLFERMKERDRLAALGEMAAGLAHEIRNPLGAIKGAAQYLDPKSLPGSEGEFLGIIIEEVDRLNTVLTQFLDYSRPWQGQMQPVQMNAAVEAIARVFSAQVPTGVDLKLELAKDIPPAQCDPEQLKQVLLNLVMNAAQAMPGGGRITIATGFNQSALDRLGVLGGIIRRGMGRAPFVEVAVADTGEGIPPEALRKIFIPFYTTKKGGTGLGLAICQKLVENNGGLIEVASRQGRGSTFTVRLPVHKT